MTRTLLQYPKGIRLAAIYTFCVHYHSGQWSRGYRLLCRSGKAWERYSMIRPRVDYWETQIDKPDTLLAQAYNYLVDNYQGDV
jgi:hypothetical protein